MYDLAVNLIVRVSGHRWIINEIMEKLEKCLVISSIYCFAYSMD